MHGESPQDWLHCGSEHFHLARRSTANAPLSLVLVGVLFCLRGMLALWSTGMLLLVGYVNVDWAFVCLFVGVGLLRRSPGCRTWALVLLWIGLILIPLAVLLTLPLPGLARFGPLWPLALLLELLMIWMLWVLNRADVRRYFDMGAPPPVAVARPHTADSWEAVTGWEPVHHRPTAADSDTVTAVVVEPPPRAGRDDSSAATGPSERELDEIVSAIATRNPTSNTA